MERAPQTLVLDASVAVKWFIEEEDTDKALLIRKRYIERALDLIAPDLVIYHMRAKNPPRSRVDESEPWVVKYPKRLLIHTPNALRLQVSNLSKT